MYVAALSCKMHSARRACETVGRKLSPVTFTVTLGNAVFFTVASILLPNIRQMLTCFLRVYIRRKSSNSECQSERAGERVAIANDETSWRLALKEVDR